MTRSAKKGSLTRQIDEFGDLEQGIVPLLMDMIEDLDRFVNLDVPFEIERRRGMITSLRDLMDRSDVSIAEKYRNIMGRVCRRIIHGKEHVRLYGRTDN